MFRKGTLVRTFAKAQAMPRRARLALAELNVMYHTCGVGVDRQRLNTDLTATTVLSIDL